MMIRSLHKTSRTWRVKPEGRCWKTKRRSKCLVNLGQTLPGFVWHFRAELSCKWAGRWSKADSCRRKLISWMSWIFSRTGADTSEFLELADRAEQVQASMIDSMPFFFTFSFHLWSCGSHAEPNPIGVLEVSGFFQAHEAASKMQERQGFLNRVDEPAGRAVWGLQGITDHRRIPRTKVCAY